MGVGAGQMSRLDSALIAAKKSERMAEALPQSCHIISDLVFDGLALACPMEID